MLFSVRKDQYAKHCAELAQSYQQKQLNEIHWHRFGVFIVDLEYSLHNILKQPLVVF